MPVKSIVKKSEYHDSISLMAAAAELAGFQGVLDAAVVMATDANKGVLKGAGLLTPEAQVATANDLVIVVSGAESVLDPALADAEKFLQRKAAISEAGDIITGASRPKTVRSAIKASPSANMVMVSVAGHYAAGEAWEALHNGLHVLLFSDNVSLEDEIALKTYAVEHGLLLMGPGAGTALVNGAALGFANAITRGPVGIVSAAGTGLQEVSTLLARHSVGVSQGIGTGGRDLNEEVGGLMMLAGLKALQQDPETQVILLISKPPSLSIARKVLAQAALTDKPVVACLLGNGQVQITAPWVQVVPTLQVAALQAARLAGAPLPEVAEMLSAENRSLRARARALRQKLKPGQQYLRGLFSGGTLCYEAQVIWRDLLPEPVFSNAPLEASRRQAGATLGQGHSAIDLGEEEFTVGRPHPMIDNSLRIRRLLQEAKDPAVAVILLDIVLGYGAHPDPAGEIARAVVKANELAVEDGRQLIFVASVTGTESDPQRRSRQVSALEAAGFVVCESNAAAARLAGEILK